MNVLQTASVRSSASLPSLPRHRDVVTQTDQLMSPGHTNPTRPLSSSSVHQRASYKTKPAPPPPPSVVFLEPTSITSSDASPSSACPVIIPPPVPPPPPSRLTLIYIQLKSVFVMYLPRSPPPLHQYCDNPGSFSYGYTSPISTLNLESSFSFSTPTHSSFKVDLSQQGVNTPARKLRSPRKKSKAPLPPSLEEKRKSKLKAWRLIPISSTNHDSAEIVTETTDGGDADTIAGSLSYDIPDNGSVSLNLFGLSPAIGDCIQKMSPSIIFSPSTRPGTPRVGTPRQVKENI